MVRPSAEKAGRTVGVGIGSGVISRRSPPGPWNRITNVLVGYASMKPGQDTNRGPPSSGSGRNWRPMAHARPDVVLTYVGVRTSTSARPVARSQAETPLSAFVLLTHCTYARPPSGENPITESVAVETSPTPAGKINEPSLAPVPTLTRSTCDDRRVRNSDWPSGD